MIPIYDTLRSVTVDCPAGVLVHDLANGSLAGTIHEPQGDDEHIAYTETAIPAGMKFIVALDRLAPPVRLQFVAPRDITRQDFCELVNAMIGMWFSEGLLQDPPLDRWVKSDEDDQQIENAIQWMKTKCGLVESQAEWLAHCRPAGHFGLRYWDSCHLQIEADPDSPTSVMTMLPDGILVIYPEFSN